MRGFPRLAMLVVTLTLMALAAANSEAQVPTATQAIAQFQRAAGRGRASDDRGR